MKRIEIGEYEIAAIGLVPGSPYCVWLSALSVHEAGGIHIDEEVAKNLRQHLFQKCKLVLEVKDGEASDD